MNFFINETNFCLQVRKSESPKFSFERQKGFFLSFAFDTKQFVFKVLEESFHCLLVRLQWVALSHFSYLSVTSLHCYLHKRRLPNPFNFANFEFVAMQNKKVTKVLGKHKQFILCDHEKCSARSKKEAEKFSLSLAARKIVIIFLSLFTAFQLIENIIPPTEPKFSRIFSAISLLLSKCNALRIPFFFISLTSPVIRLDLLFIFYFVANFYTFCMIQWKIKIKNF